MQHLFLDCSHGMSGDMTLASLAHLGVDLSPLPGLLAQAGVACRLEVWPDMWHVFQMFPMKKAAEAM